MSNILNQRPRRVPERYQPHPLPMFFFVVALLQLAIGFFVGLVVGNWPAAAGLLVGCLGSLFTWVVLDVLFELRWQTRRQAEVLDRIEARGR